MIIEESGMVFDVPDDVCFRIEKSAVYNSIQNRVQIAEFLWYRKNVILCVEAKPSTPHPATQPRFDEFLLEIKDKLLNAFSLYIAMRLNRHPARSELPDTFETLDLSVVNIQFVLIVNGYKKDWLPLLRESLFNTLYPTIKVWNFGSNPLIVLNDVMARDRGLIR